MARRDGRYYRRSCKHSLVRLEHPENLKHGRGAVPCISSGLATGPDQWGKKTPSRIPGLSGKVPRTTEEYRVVTLGVKAVSKRLRLSLLAWPKFQWNGPRRAASTSRHICRT